jgi:hypothetical protein
VRSQKKKPIAEVSKGDSKISVSSYQGAAVEAGLEERVKIPAMLRHMQTFANGRFLPPVFAFSHEDDARHALITYRNRGLFDKKPTLQYLAAGPFVEYGQAEVDMVRHEHISFGLVLEVPQAQSNQAERYQMCALGALMLFNVNGVVDPGLAPRGIDMDLEGDSTFMHPVLDGTHVHTYRVCDNSKGPVGVVMFNPDAPQFTSFTAGLAQNNQAAVDAIAGVSYDDMPARLEEPVLVSVRRPKGPEAQELIEMLAPSVAQVSFIRAAWHEGTFS